MKQLLYVQPIFIPDIIRYNENLKSIDSFADYIMANRPEGINITFAFGGWSYSDELWAGISFKIKQFFGVDPIRFDRNYGKAYIVNNLVERYSVCFGLNYDAILTADSDIIYTLSTEAMFERLYYMAHYMELHKKIPYGIIALNQLQQCCHLPMCYENELAYMDEKGRGERVVWPHAPAGIAGGCLFINRKAWDAVGGYRVMGVYAGDDAYILIDIANKGFSYQMASNIGVIHPFNNNDTDYNQWKVMVCQRDSYGKVNNNYSQQIAEAEQMWNEKRQSK